jgi:hypothetical protein
MQYVRFGNKEGARMKLTERGIIGFAIVVMVLLMIYGFCGGPFPF